MYMASAKEPRSQVVDFTTPDAFESVLVNVDTLKSGEEINVALIKKNSILYRAGSVNARTADESAPGWNSPLFMSDLESIAPYRNSGRALMRGITKKNLVLFILEMDNIVKILGELYGKSDKPELFAEFRKSGELKYKYNPYAPEVVICKPNDNLIHGPVRSSTASAKGTSKKGRKRRTKHKSGTKNKRR